MQLELPLDNPNEVRSKMNTDVVLGIVRQVLLAAGGVAVGAGYLSNDNLTTIVGGLVAIVGAIWAYFNNKNTAAVKAQLVEATTPQPPAS